MASAPAAAPPAVVAALPRHELARLAESGRSTRTAGAPTRRLAIERRAEHERAEGQPVLARRHETHLRRVFKALEADGCLLERERRRALGGAGGRTVIAQLWSVEQDRVDGGDELLGAQRVGGARLVAHRGEQQHHRRAALLAVDDEDGLAVARDRDAADGVRRERRRGAERDVAPQPRPVLGDPAVAALEERHEQPRRRPRKRAERQHVARFRRRDAALAAQPPLGDVLDKLHVGAARAAARERDVVLVLHAVVFVHGGDNCSRV